MQPSRSLLILAAALHALLMWAAFPPVNLWPLIVLAPAPLAWLAIRAPSTRFAVLAAIAVHIVLWAWMSRWLVEVTIVGFPFYVLAMSAWNGGMFVWIFRRVHLRPRSVGSRLPMTLTLPIVWVAVEAIRGEVIVDGYPWYFLAHPLVEAPILAQSADLFGVYFVSFLAAMVSGAILDVVLRQNVKTVHHHAVSPSRRLIIAAVVFIHVANIAYGTWRLNQTAPLSEGPAMLVVQTNLPQDNKLRWTAEDKVRDFHEFLQITAEGYQTATTQDQPIDLIIWPETMLPGFGLEPETLRYLDRHGYDLEYYFAEHIVGSSRAVDIPFLVGSPAVIGLGTDETVINGEAVRIWTWERQYNSSYLIQGDLPFQRYDKFFLTPFGETMPYFRAWPALERRVLALGARGMSFNLDHGEDLDTLNLEWRSGTARLATPICFESTIGWVNRRLVYHRGEKRADALINLTNDGWFAWQKSGRIQHAQIGRYRAIENRVPMVRSANTGVSVSIDSSGRVISVIGENPYGTPIQAGYLYTTVTFDARHSLYGRIGDLWAWMCVVLAAIILIATWFKEK